MTVVGSVRKRRPLHVRVAFLGAARTKPPDTKEQSWHLPGLVSTVSQYLILSGWKQIGRHVGCPVTSPLHNDQPEKLCGNAKPGILVADDERHSEHLTPDLLMYVVDAIIEMEKTVPGIAAEYAAGLKVLEESASPLIPARWRDRALLLQLRQKLELAASCNKAVE